MEQPGVAPRPGALPGLSPPGEVGQFSLATYADARRRRDRVLKMVESREMPPWKPVPGFGDFLGSRRLADRDVELIRAWVAAGAPEGDPRDLPPPRRSRTRGRTARPTRAGARRGLRGPVGRPRRLPLLRDPHRLSRGPLPHGGRVRPRQPKVVHHVLTFVDTQGRGRGARPRRARSGLHVLRRAPASGPGQRRRMGPGLRAHRHARRRRHAAARGRPRRRAGPLPQPHRRAADRPHAHRPPLREDAGRQALALRPDPEPGVHHPAGAERHEVRASWTVPPAWNVHATGVPRTCTCSAAR